LRREETGRREGINFGWIILWNTHKEKEEPRNGFLKENVSVQRSGRFFSPFPPTTTATRRREGRSCGLPLSFLFLHVVVVVVFFPLAAFVRYTNEECSGM
jgi:hypothetical protein